MRAVLPYFFYVNAMGLVVMLTSRFVHSSPWHGALQWGGAAVLLCGVVLLILRK